MGLRDAAGALGVHYQTAYAWVRQGLLPARKIGRARRARVGRTASSRWAIVMHGSGDG